MLPREAKRIWDHLFDSNHFMTFVIKNQNISLQYRMAQFEQMLFKDHLMPSPYFFPRVKLGKGTVAI